MSHTTPPWVLDDNHMELPDDYYMDDYIVGAAGEVIAAIITMPGRISREQEKANAAHIVKSANAYQPMVDLLRTIYRTGGFQREIEEALNGTGEVL